MTANLIEGQLKLLREKFLWEMLRIRRVEERIAERYPEGEMRCPVHLSSGQEAAAVGVCAALSEQDQALSTHRCHAHYLAKGGNLKAMLAEIYGKATGCCKGKGGSMHLVDLAAGFLGAAPIVGSTIPISVGAAFGDSFAPSKKRVTVAFFGDGATEEGVFHESLNFAALKKLPVMFVCENNLYSVYSQLGVRQPAGRSRADIASAHGLSVFTGDGNDVQAVHRLALEAVAHCRAGLGPTFLELSTYRWREHCGPFYDDQLGYRPTGELEEWQRRCPIERLRAELISTNSLSEEQIEHSLAKIEAEIDDAFEFAKASPYPHERELLTDVFAINGRSMADQQSESKGSRNIRCFEAIHEALDEALARDRSVYVMGLGVPDPKGVFGTTLGLASKYGANRVLDTPTSENGMTGIAIGSALTGMRPVMVHQRLDFAMLAVEQIVNQAANWQYMYGGVRSMPLVIRLIVGRGWGQGPQHSQALHAWFAHVPGLKVVAPAFPDDAKGLLTEAIGDDNPVIFIEHRWCHNLMGSVPHGSYSVPIGKARIVQEGSDLTIVAVSYMVIEALQAAQKLSEHGISCEVIDLRSIRPLDFATIQASLMKTKRLIVADTGWTEFGVSAEIITRACEQGVEFKCPPVRHALPACPSPCTPALSKFYYPRWEEIANSACKMLGNKTTFARGADAHLDVPDKSFTGPF